LIVRLKVITMGQAQVVLSVLQMLRRVLLWQLLQLLRRLCSLTTVVPGPQQQPVLRLRPQQLSMCEAFISQLHMNTLKMRMATAQIGLGF
jgi:hypothetical protein